MTIQIQTVSTIIGSWHWYRNPIKWWRWRRFMADVRRHQQVMDDLAPGVRRRIERDLDEAFFFGESVASLSDTDEN